MYLIYMFVNILLITFLNMPDIFFIFLIFFFFFFFFLHTIKWFQVLLYKLQFNISHLFAYTVCR